MKSTEGHKTNRGNAPISRNTQSSSKPIRNFRSETRESIFGEINRSTLDDVGPVGGEQRSKLLSEMNSLVDDHEEFVKSLGPRVDVL